MNRPGGTGNSFASIGRVLRKENIPPSARGNARGEMKRNFSAEAVWTPAPEVMCFEGGQELTQHAVRDIEELDGCAEIREDKSAAAYDAPQDRHQPEPVPVGQRRHERTCVQDTRLK